MYRYKIFKPGTVEIIAVGTTSTVSDGFESTFTVSMVNGEDIPLFSLFYCPDIHYLGIVLGRSENELNIGHFVKGLTRPSSKTRTTGDPLTLVKSIESSIIQDGIPIKFKEGSYTKTIVVVDENVATQGAVIAASLKDVNYDIIVDTSITLILNNTQTIMAPPDSNVVPSISQDNYNAVVIKGSSKTVTYYLNEYSIEEKKVLPYYRYMYVEIQSDDFKNTAVSSLKPYVNPSTKIDIPSTTYTPRGVDVTYVYNKRTRQGTIVQVDYSSATTTITLE